MREAHTRIYYTMVSSILFGSPCCAGIPALGKRTQPNRRRSFETVTEAAEAVPEPEVVQVAEAKPHDAA